MKQLIQLLFMFFLLLSCNYGLFAGEEKIYSSQGTIEISGDVYGSISCNQYGSSYSLSFYPGINYFFFKNIYIGVIPGFSYRRLKQESLNTVYHDYSFMPSFSPGYTLEISNRLFFDISPAISYAYFHSFRDHEVDFYFITTLKYDTGGALINLNLMQSFVRYASNSWETFYLLTLGLGFSIYF
ncbi:MAG: hypothetical protein GY756_27635, partial [bacterium]|nr:hypothetical protein [bacterium]